MGKRTFAITPATRMALKDALERVGHENVVSKSDMGATILICDANVQLMDGGGGLCHTDRRQGCQGCRNQVLQGMWTMIYEDLIVQNRKKKCES